MRTLFANPAIAAVLIVMTVAWPASKGAEPPSVELQDAQAKPEHRVTGDVVDRDGKPVEDAEVVFAGPKKGSVHTEPNGAFSFTGPPGNYVVTVRAGTRTQTFDDMKIEDGQLKPRTRLVIDRADPQQ